MKIPFNEEETLNIISQEEFNELSWLDRQLGIVKSTISTTEELASKYKKPIDDKDQSKTFETFKFDFILLAIGGVILIGLVINALGNTKDNQGFNMVILFLILFAALGFVAVNFDPTRNLKITLSREGVPIKEFTYTWREIYKIYIVKRRQENNYSYFLVLALDTGVTDRYEFTGLMGFNAAAEKLSAYIEYYKKFA